MKNKIEIGNPLILLDEVSSTNDFVLEKLKKEEIKAGTAWYANYQFKGKGQRGKSWIAAAGDNINLSLVLCPQAWKSSETFKLNTLIALAVYDFYKEIVGEGVFIKWSNDIYFKDKKAGGILIENVFRGKKWKYAVVGIGMNLNQVDFDERLPNPVSLRQLTGKKWDPVELTRKLCKYIEKKYNDTEGYAHLMKEYEEKLYRLNKPGLYKEGDTVFEGTIRGVKENGRLLLEKEGKVKEVDFGEIKFIF